LVNLDNDAMIGEMKRIIDENFKNTRI